MLLLNKLKVSTIFSLSIIFNSDTPVEQNILE
jgi:hypothetical protein